MVYNTYPLGSYPLVENLGEGVEIGLGGAAIPWGRVLMLRGLVVAMGHNSPLTFSGGVREPATA